MMLNLKIACRKHSDKVFTLFSFFEILKRKHLFEFFPFPLLSGCYYGEIYSFHIKMYGIE